MANESLQAVADVGNGLQIPLVVLLFRSFSLRLVHDRFITLAQIERKVMENGSESAGILRSGSTHGIEK